MISEDDKRKEENTKTSRSWPQNRPYVEREGDVLKLWGIFLFGFIGAAVTTFAVGQLRRTSEWFYTEFSRSSKGTTGGSFHSGFKEEAWRQYKRRLRDHYEEEMERVERIRRMQRAFNRERNRYKRSYERWSQYGPEAYHQHFQGDDWYWTTETSYNEQRANSSAYPHGSGNYSLSHHYSVLGLDRWRTKPYTDQEIKSAFREKAMQYHPDQNLDNKEAAEAKFKEVLMSYETIKSERKNERL